MIFGREGTPEKHKLFSGFALLYRAEWIECFLWDKKNEVFKFIYKDKIGSSCEMYG